MVQPRSDVSLQIGLIGTYDIDNYGDCIFPEIYTHLLKAYFPKAQFSLYSPHAKPAEILSFPHVKALPATLAKAEFAEDCLILTGGETLCVGHNNASYIFPVSTMGHYLRMWLGPAVAASRSPTKFLIHAAGVPGWRGDIFDVMSQLLRSADHVSVRDEASHKRLGGNFLTEVDPVFLLPEIMSAQDWQSLAQKHLPKGLLAGGYIALQISPNYAAGKFTEWCDQVAQVLRQTNKAGLFVPICHFLHDQKLFRHARTLIANRHPDIADRLFMLKEDRRNVKATAALIACSDGYIGSSLHGAVTAAAFAKPMAVFTGAGGKDGKHFQTLKTAGISQGTTDQINAISACFARSQSQDLASLRNEAMRRAREGADRLAAEILAKKGPLQAPNPSDLKAIAHLDQITASSPATRLRRNLVVALSHIPLVRNWYQSYKLRRRLLNS